MKILYLSYDGLLEPLGESQVLSYLRQLSPKHQIFIVSFEKSVDWMQSERRKNLETTLKESGIGWQALRYHKTPTGLATAYDILIGFIVCAWFVYKQNIQIIHARSYVPAVISLGLMKLFRVRFVFDMRGFWADERVDGDLWPADGIMYKVAKFFERRFLLSADTVVSLTHAAVEEMKAFSYLQEKPPRFKVITTCTDLDVFKPDNSIRTDNHTFTLGYVGSVGVWYLFEESLLCFKKLQLIIPDAHLYIANREDHFYIRERVAAADINPSSVTIEALEIKDVARAMHKMDAGIFLIKPAYSKLASAPTKLGEFLGCGLPCLSNTGVGDMTEILEGEHVGIALENFSQETLTEGINQLVKLTNERGIKERCRKAALRHFSLADGVKAYDDIYKSMSLDS